MKRFWPWLLLLLGIALLTVACQRPAATPTPTPRPAQAVTTPQQTPTQVAARPAPQQTIKLTCQASWPTGSLLFEQFTMLANRVKELSGGRLELETLPAGAVVDAFEVLDATSRGVIDCAHTWPGYWVGKNPAAALFYGAGVPFGMDAIDFWGWYVYGGGLDLWQEFYDGVLGLKVVVVPVIYAGPQVLGWFKKPITSWEDMKGLKWRIAGIAGQVWQKAGSSTVQLPGGEILPAAERGVIDGAEWVTPGEDLKMGFHDVWKYYGMPALGEYVTIGEFLVNKDKWNGLPKDLQEIIRAATFETTWIHWLKLQRENATALKELQEKHGVKIFRTPTDVLQKYLDTWINEVAAGYIRDNPFFKRVWDSQKEYASWVVPARAFIEPDKLWLAKYFWPDGGKVGYDFNIVWEASRK